MGCDSCALQTCQIIRPSGVTGGIAIVGEAPGLTEVAKKAPFVGKSGRLLRESLKLVGIDPETCWITNAVLCFPGEGKTPTPTTWSNCRGRLIEELVEAGVTKILAVGGVALSSLLGSTKALPITKYRGQGMMVEVGTRQVYLVPTYHPAAVLRDPDLFRDFISDIYKFSVSSSPMKLEPAETWIPQSRDEGLELLSYLKGASVLSCDLETTGFDFLSHQILSIGFGALREDMSGVSLLITRDLIDEMKDDLLEFFETYPGTLVFHNIKFDAKFLITLYGRPVKFLRPMDTMMMAYAADERPFSRYGTVGLKSLARVRYDLPDYHFDFDSWLAVPEAERDWDSLFRYHSLDCYCTVRLFFELESELVAESPRLMSLVSNILVPGQLCYAIAEHRGALVDVPYLEAMKIDISGRLKIWEEQLSEIAIRYGIENLNPKSSVQVNKILREKFGLNVTTTEREELQALIRQVTSDFQSGKGGTQDQIDFLTLLLDHRQWSKMLSTYVEGLLKKVHPVDGRVHSDFLLHGTATGRLSSTEPNLQNIPTLIGQEIRRAFIARPGYVIVGVDYSQLELRVAGLLSKDETLIRSYREGQDLHKLVAAAMYQKPVAEVTKLERYMAKYIDFGIIYGRGAPSLVNGWEMEHYVTVLGGTRWTLPQAEAFIERFLSDFPGLKAWIEKQHEAVLVNNFVETPFGRRRRFPFRPDFATASAIQRKAVNTPIQSTASDLCLSAGIRLTDCLPEDVYLLFSVHDALYFEVREDLLDQVVPVIVQEMTENLPPEIDRTILPFEVDPEVGLNWGDLQPWRRDDGK